MTTINRRFELLLKAAYFYYWEHDDIMTDAEYDVLARIVSFNEKKVTHELRDLVDFEALRNSTSLFYIRKDDYPDYIKKPLKGK